MHYDLGIVIAINLLTFAVWVSTTNIVKALMLIKDAIEKTAKKEEAEGGNQ